DLDPGEVLLGQLPVDRDRVHRADDLALLALDAHVRIDVVLRSVRLGMDAGNGTHLDARPVERAQLGYYVAHAVPSGASGRSVWTTWSAMWMRALRAADTSRPWAFSVPRPAAAA